MVSGTKAWITHAGQADFYTVMVRTIGRRRRPWHVAACCWTRARRAFGFGALEHKMGLTGSPTAQLLLDGARIPVARRLGAEGQGLKIALEALDSGRLGIAACAVGLAQAALDEAVEYAKGRSQFGQPIIDFQGLQFHAGRHGRWGGVGPGHLPGRSPAPGPGPAVPPGRPPSPNWWPRTWPCGSPRTRCRWGTGIPGTSRSSATCGKTKVPQIFEGTNQVQRMVIARELRRETR